MNASSKDPPIVLKNQVAAAVLAFLVPGAGHFYQGRIFKGVIYFVCILTLFVWGMQMGHWQILFRLEPSSTYYRDEFLQGAQFEEFRQQMELQAPSRRYAKTHWGYFAQAPVGMFSVPAFFQEERYYSNNNSPSVPESVQTDTPIEALLAYLDDERDYRTLSLTGQLELSPVQTDFGPELQGTFRGQTEDGQEVVVELSGAAILDAPIGAVSYRELRVSASRLGDELLNEGVLVAKTHRSFMNSFLVPPNYSQLEALHYTLGKKYTLADVFTWIAGLLNVLAIWDAFAGPAYGYRMPVLPEEERKKKSKPETEPEPTAASTEPV